MVEWVVRTLPKIKIAGFTFLQEVIELKPKFYLQKLEIPKYTWNLLSNTFRPTLQLINAEKRMKMGSEIGSAMLNYKEK